MKLLRTPVALLALLIFTAEANALGDLTRLSIYDRTARRDLPVYEHDGRYYVVGQPGNEYQIRLHNQCGADLLAVISVDGINVVSGETADWNQGGYVLDAWRAMDIKGWRKSLERTAAFYFTRLPDSYAARTGRPDNVGVIGVATFQRRRHEPDRPYLLERDDSARGPVPPFPAAEPQAPSARAGVDGKAESGAPSGHSRDEAAALGEAERLGTGHGRSEASRVRYTSFERASETPAEVVTIYYDSYRNLLAQGVIPQAPLAVLPEPFPDRFVPDPAR